jgi:hypothetical protein
MSAFTRFLIPAVRLETAQGVIENLDGRGLLFEWTIDRDNTNKVDRGTVSIYNLDPKLAGEIESAWSQLSNSSGYLITFSLGWEGIVSRVLVGDVWDLVAAKRTPTDTIMTLEIGDGNKNLRDQTVLRGFKSVALDIVLEWLVSLPPASADAGGGGLGLTYPAESKALIKTAQTELDLQTFSNIAPGCSVKTAVDIIMDTLGLEWRVQNGAFIALRGGIINRPGVILRPSSGLIDYTKRNDGGCVLTAYANPEIEPGLQVQVQDDQGRPFGAPVYRTERIGFRGSSRGESIMNIEGARPHGT